MSEIRQNEKVEWTKRSEKGEETSDSHLTHGGFATQSTLSIDPDVLRLNQVLRLRKIEILGQMTRCRGSGVDGHDDDGRVVRQLRVKLCVCEGHKG